jgi:hypothetical protein
MPQVSGIDDLCRRSAARGRGNLSPPQFRRWLNYYAVSQYSQYSHIRVTGGLSPTKMLKHPAELSHIKVLFNNFKEFEYHSDIQYIRYIIFLRRKRSIFVVGTA